MTHLSASAILARLLDSPQAPRSLKRFQRVLDALDAISESIHSTLDAEVVMQRAVGAAAEAMGCDTAAISLVQNEHWEVAHVVGFPEGIVGSVMTPDEEPHAALAVTTRRPVAIDDVLDDDRVNREHMQKWGIRSVLVVPLLAGNDVLGVIFLNYQRAVRAFDDLDLHFAERLASSLTLALTNARLHRALRQELAERSRAEARSERDLAALKRTEQSLRNANARLEEADRLKDEFIAVLSHELRNPLAPIRYALPLLQRAELPEQAAMAAGVVERQVLHLTRLVDDLLDISRIRTGKIELRPEYVTLRTVIKHAVEEAGPAIAKRSHSVLIEVPSEPIWVHGDPARLAQVVTNLLDNSAKYTPRGGQLRVVASCTGEHAVIRVSDNGIGIPAGYLGSVFEMFQQVNASRETPGGLGIGLALVKRIVEMHQGSVEAHSDGPGRGSEFIVCLPLARGVEGRAEEARSVPSAMKRLRVLLVDDNPDLVAMLALFVESFGHDVQKAFDGTSAVSAAASYRPHVVVLDLRLPGMTGLEVARELRRRPETSAAYLVALTGNGQETDRHDSQDAGFDAHLTKPTDPDVLERLLRSIAEGVQPKPQA